MRLYDYPASANCYKVRLLCAQLHLPYERVEVDIFDGGTLTDDFARINPARTTPVLELAAGRYLVESNAILVYLADGTALYPDDRFEQAQALRWLLFEQADVVPSMGGLRFRLLTGRLAPDDPDVGRRRAAAADALQTIESHLAGREFLASDGYTIADIALYAYIHVADQGGISLESYPAVRAWLRRVAAQPEHVNDLRPYPPNASRLVGRSIYG
ncbi:MAG: glutathione S-transferase family protein [Solirubrobacteraceae bacterium]